eukprot:4811511-Amphidinium_carterae.2
MSPMTVRICTNCQSWASRWAVMRVFSDAHMNARKHTCMQHALECVEHASSTSLSLIHKSWSELNAVASQIQAIAQYIDTCTVSRNVSLPGLSVQVGDSVLHLSPDDYVDRDDDGCSLALMALEIPPPKGPLFIFGDPFLR